MAWKYRFVIAACARWEAPYAAEWLTYHRALGFEHVYLYCNDDDPAELYEAVLPFTQGPNPFVTFRFFPEQGMQRKMLLHFCAHNGQDSEWVSFLDLDEFLRLPPGQTLPDYMRGFEDKTDCLMFNWVYCGPNGHKTPPKSVLKDLTRRQASVHPFTKMLFRSWILGLPELFRNAPDCSFLHRLHQYVGTNIRPMNVLGEDMTDYYDDAHFAELADGWAHGKMPLNRIFESGAFIHHYAFRTETAFTDRVARGLGGDFSGQDHWGRVAVDETLRIGFTNSINSTEDLALAKAWEGIIASSAQLTVEPVSDPPLLPAAPKPGRKTCAVVLIVKNEASDILSWVAWYRMLGVDTVIVYDDDSTDGTWEALLDAARHYDIRLHRTAGPRDTEYQVRQRISYLKALADYQDEFEWLGFFDLDEYLLLRQDQQIGSFLARFPDADAVGINWCNYGSSGHMLKPDTPPPLTYLHHGPQSAAVNKHIKCFVRPKAVGSHWINVHCFDVPPERAVDASGNRLAFGETQGIIAGTPDWSVAKLMHYQCRSMEHFIERLKRRPQFRDMHGLWKVYDVSDVKDEEALAHAEALLRNMAELAAPPAPPTDPLTFIVGIAEPDTIDDALAKGDKVVAVQPDARLYYTLAERFAAPLAEGRLVLENFAPAPRGGEIAMLIPAGGGRPYPVATISWEDLVAKHGRPARVRMGAEIPGYPAMAG